MILDWKKVALVVAIVAAFITLSVLKILPSEATVTGMAALLGWVGGLFTPTPKSEPTEVKVVHVSNGADQ